MPTEEEKEASLEDEEGERTRTPRGRSRTPRRVGREQEAEDDGGGKRPARAKRNQNPKYVESDDEDDGEASPGPKKKRTKKEASGNPDAVRQRAKREKAKQGEEILGDAEVGKRAELDRQTCAEEGDADRGGWKQTFVAEVVDRLARMDRRQQVTELKNWRVVLLVAKLSLAKDEWMLPSAKKNPGRNYVAESMKMLSEHSSATRDTRRWTGAPQWH